jgi:excisionase family DNA binding protein
MYGKMIPIHKEANLMGIYKETEPLVSVRDKILVNKQEASALISLAESTIERLMKKKAIPYIRIGGRVLFSLEKLIEWAAAKASVHGNAFLNEEAEDKGGQNE